MNRVLYGRRAGLLLAVIAPFALSHCDRIKTPAAKEKPKAATGPMAAGPIEIRDIAASEFSETIKTEGKLTVVAYHSEAQDVSKVMCTMLKYVGKDFSGRSMIARINVDQAQELSKREGVGEIPDVRFYVDGKMVDRFVGFQQIEEVRTRFKNCVPGGDATAATQTPAEGTSTEPAIKPMTKDWVPSGLEKRR